MIGPWQIVLVFLFLIIPAALLIIALIDILPNEFTGSNKLIWVLVAILLPIFGPILYFIVGRKQKLKKQ